MFDVVGPSDRFPLGRRDQAGVGIDELLTPGLTARRFCRLFPQLKLSQRSVQTCRLAISGASRMAQAISLSERLCVQ